MPNSVSETTSQTIILASSSAYRKALLARLNIHPLCIAPDIDETPLADENAEQTAQRLAAAKAHASIAKYIDGGASADQAIIVIGSDQVLLHDGQKLGKPGNYENAVRQLKNLSGQQVTFFTALSMFYYPNLHGFQTILSKELNRISSQKESSQSDSIRFFQACDQSHVQYRVLNDEIIQAYLNKEPAFDCAGSTKSEALGLALIQQIENKDPSALIGLPLIQVCDGLNDFNYCVIRQAIHI
jgi:septum formation protein